MTMSSNSTNTRNPLLVTDLFQCVLDCLIISLPQRPSKEERRMLAVLARTCRAFSEPSLDTLWRRLNSLLPLVRCFSHVADMTRVTTPPSPPEWLAINRYSPRVRELTLGNEPLSLHFLHCAGVVLPNLRVIRWICQPKFATAKFPIDSATLIWSLFTPNIVTLEVQLEKQDDPSYRLFLESYPTLCPNLRSIKFNFIYPIQGHKANLQALSQAICSNADWQHVDLSPPTDIVVLKHLGGCSNLKTVSLTLTPQALQPDKVTFKPEETPFRSVLDLQLTQSNPLDLATSLLRPHDQVFHSFGVTVHTPDIGAEVSTLLTALASPQRVRSLRSISIIHDIPSGLGTSNNGRHHQPLSYHTFHSLVPLLHLRKLAIDLKHPTALDDGEFASLVRNWPLLEVFRMTWAHGEVPVASVTLRGLLSLIMSCRKLRTIGLTLDARDVPVVDKSTNVCTHSITFHDSPLQHPDLVAKFLSKHLPSVRWVEASFTRGFTLGAPMTDPNTNLALEHKRLWLDVRRHLGHPVFTTCIPTHWQWELQLEKVDYY